MERLDFSDREGRDDDFAKQQFPDGCPGIEARFYPQQFRATPEFRLRTPRYYPANAAVGRHSNPPSHRGTARGFDAHTEYVRLLLRFPRLRRRCSRRAACGSFWDRHFFRYQRLRYFPSCTVWRLRQKADSSSNLAATWNFVRGLGLIYQFVFHTAERWIAYSPQPKLLPRLARRIPVLLTAGAARISSDCDRSHSRPLIVPVHPNLIAADRLKCVAE